MSNLFRREFAGWMPNADAVNGPPGAMLRADNLIWDEAGIPALRRGSAKLFTGLADPDIRSLYTTIINDTKVRMAGAATKVYKDGVALDATFDPGDTDIRFGAGGGMVFMAGGTVKKKTDGTNLFNWGLKRPSKAPIVTAIDSYTAEFASCDQAEAPGFVAEEGTLAYSTGEAGVANSALQVTPALTTGRGTVRKDFGSDNDFFNIAGYEGFGADIFDMAVWIAEPEKVQTITVMIGISTTTDAFQTDYYYFDFKLGGSKANVVDIGAGVAEAISQEIRDKSDGEPKTRITREERADRIQDRREDRRRERKDKAHNPGWTHLACTRAQFNRVGGTPGRDWTKVRSIKLIYQATAGSTGVCKFDTVVMKGGSSERALSGVFTFKYVCGRRFDNYIALSGPSPASEPVRLNCQAVQVTIPLDAMLEMDPQTEFIWIYFFGGVLDRYYKTANEVSDEPITSIRLDEFARTADGATPVADRVRLNGFEFSIPTTPGVRSDLVVDIYANEADALTQDEFLEEDCVPPPDNIISIAGPHFARMLALTSDHLWFTVQHNPDGFMEWQKLAVGGGIEINYWVFKTSGGVFVGTSRDIYELVGTGQAADDGTVDLRLQPLHVGTPPSGPAADVSGSTIIFQTPSGFSTFDGVSTTHLPDTDLDLLFKGQTRHGVAGSNLDGRIRLAVCRGQMVAMIPEGADDEDTDVLYRFDTIRSRWYRHVYPYRFRSIFKEYDSDLVAGDTAGEVLQLDTGTDDAGTLQPVVAWTKVDDDGTPLRRKDAFDFQIKLDTGGAVASSDLHLDGSASSSKTVTCSMTGESLHKENVSDLTGWRQAQVRVTGSFSTFRLYEMNLAYRPRPQARMFVDTGFITTGLRGVTWMRDLFVKLCAPADVRVKVYADEDLVHQYDIKCDPNVPRPYKVPVPRSVNGYQFRITLEATTQPGITEVAFEAYWIQPTFYTGGDQTERRTMTLALDEATS